MTDFERVANREYPKLWETFRGWYGQRHEWADMTGPWGSRDAAEAAMNGDYMVANMIEARQAETAE